jgi:hypothetical protein
MVQPVLFFVGSILLQKYCYKMAPWRLTCYHQHMFIYYMDVKSIISSLKLFVIFFLSTVKNFFYSGYQNSPCSEKLMSTRIF